MTGYELLALRYLADLWELQPGHSEDVQTCRQNARVLRCLLCELEALGHDVTERRVKAAVHRARGAGLDEGSHRGRQ